MARIPPVTRERVREDLRGLFDDVSSGSGGVGTGPMSVLKYSPEMSRRAIPLFQYVRNESILPHKVRELAMLTTARAKDCPYIWTARYPERRRVSACAACRSSDSATPKIWRRSAAPRDKGPAAHHREFRAVWPGRAWPAQPPEPSMLLPSILPRGNTGVTEKACLAALPNVGDTTRH